MKESFFRRFLNSLLDRRDRANAMARIAAVVAGLTACALALAPVLENTATAQPGHFATFSAESHAARAPRGVNGAEYLPARYPPAGVGQESRQIDTF